MTQLSGATASSSSNISESLQSGAGVCWSCGAGRAQEELFCIRCGKIQPPSSDPDYFSVFHLPEKLTIDGAALEREFYQLSRKLHPDVYVRASPQEQEWSLAGSSLLNDAYRALKDPIRRAEYLLKLKGESSEDSGERKPDRTPPDLLEEVFELNMQLDEMRSIRKIGEADRQLESDLQGAKANFDQQLKASDEQLLVMFEEWDASVEKSDPETEGAVRARLGALLDRRRYLRNLIESVQEALEA